MPVVLPGSVPLPPSFEGLLEVATTVVAPSEFAASVARLGAPCPVEVVHFPTRGAGRAEPAAPGAPCTFLTVVDAGTPVAQANPRAVVSAFREAFGPAARGSLARLLVVLAGAGSRLEARSELEAETARVGGELVADCGAGRVDELVAAADVYVSLHRATGFGLRMADAMAAGRPVVATGWSGSLDFMGPRSACLVGYTVAPLLGGELYEDARADVVRDRGAFWVEPDVAGAARWMRQLAADAGYRARVGASAARQVQESLAPEVVGPALRSLVERVEALPVAADAIGRAVRWPPPRSAAGGAR
ncbi:MAG: glycosyltransferase [Actinomycetota bacterium]|nr:glycosyltransferase [Actinomycetota bacterium]